MPKTPRDLPPGAMLAITIALCGTGCLDRHHLLADAAHAL